MAWSDYGVLIKRNGEYLTEEEMDEFYNETKYDGHGACGTKDLYIESYKHNLQVIHEGQVIFNRYDRSDLDYNLDIGEVVTPLLHIDMQLKYYNYDRSRIMCSYIHPITKDKYEMLFGAGVGKEVYDWWKNFLGMDDEENDCILEF